MAHSQNIPLSLQRTGDANIQGALLSTMTSPVASISHERISSESEPQSGRRESIQILAVFHKISIHYFSLVL